MKRTNPVATLLSALILSACSIGPDFRVPETPAGPGYLAQREMSGAEQRIVLGQHVQAEWWTLFASAPLEELVQQALAGNHDLAAARETLAQAEESVRAEQGRLAPQISLDALAGRQKYGVALFGPSNFFIPPFTYYETGPALTWNLDWFGAGRRKVERRQALAEYQAHELEALYVVLTGNVVSQAIQLSALGEEIGTLQQLVAADESLLALTIASAEAGAASQRDVLEARSRLASDRALLPPLRQRRSQSVHLLATLLGKAPADWSPPALPFSSLRFPAALPVILPSDLIRHRPDILAAEANLHAVSATLGIATANLYPNLTLSADMLQEALTPARLFNSVSSAWALAGGLTAPLFSGGTLSAEKREAEHAYQAALAEYRQAIVLAFGQVADALAALGQDEPLCASRQVALETARRGLELSRASRAAGGAGLPEIESAKREVANSEARLIEAEGQRQLDGARLFVSLAGSPVAAQPAAPLANR